MRSPSRKRPPVPCSAQDFTTHQLDSDPKRRKLPYSAPNGETLTQAPEQHVFFPETDLSEGSHLPPPYAFDPAPPPPWNPQPDHTRSLEEPLPRLTGNLRNGVQSDPPGYERRAQADIGRAPCSSLEQVPTVVGSRRLSSAGFEVETAQWSVLDHLRRMTCEHETMMDEWCQLDNKVRAFQRSFTELYQCKEILLHRIESLMKQTQYAVSALTPACNHQTHPHGMYMASGMQADDPETGGAAEFSPQPSPYSLTFWPSQDVARPLPVSPVAVPVQAAMIEEEEVSRPEHSFCDEEEEEYDNLLVSSQKEESTSNDSEEVPLAPADDTPIYDQETTSSEEEEEEEEELDLDARVPTTNRGIRDGGKAPAKFPVRRPASKSLIRAGSGASDDLEGGGGGDTQDEDALDAISSDFPQDDNSAPAVSLEDPLLH